MIDDNSVCNTIQSLRQLAWDNLVASDEEVTKVKLFLSNYGLHQEGTWGQLLQEVIEDWNTDSLDDEVPEGCFWEILND